MFDGRWRGGVDRGTQPVGQAFVRLGVTADTLTASGLVMSVVTAVVIGSGHFLAGALLMIPTGLPDLFDGPVAKASGTASVRGAFFDSVADRVSDAFLLGGVAWYLISRNHGETALIPFAVLAVAYLISYQRSKAELLGIPAKGGLMERAERMILLGLSLIVAAVSPAALVGCMIVMLALVCCTATGRFTKIWSMAQGPMTAKRFSNAAADETTDLGALTDHPGGGIDDPAGHDDHETEPIARLWRRGKVDSRWRSWRVARSSQPAEQSDAWVPYRATEPLRRWRARRAETTARRNGQARRERHPARQRQRVTRRSGSSGF